MFDILIAWRSQDCVCSPLLLILKCMGGPPHCRRSTQTKTKRIYSYHIFCILIFRIRRQNTTTAHLGAVPHVQPAKKLFINIHVSALFINAALNYYMKRRRLLPRHSKR